MTAPTMHDLLIQLADIDVRVAAGKATAGDVDAAVDVALTAAAALDGWRGVESQAKRIIAAALDAGSIDQFKASGATVQRGKPVPTIRYSAHALDVLCASYPDIARVLAPHRREGLRAGSLRIVKGANGNGHNGGQS